jgi:hypothetical protein
MTFVCLGLALLSLVCLVFCSCASIRPLYEVDRAKAARMLTFNRHTVFNHLGAV